MQQSLFEVKNLKYARGKTPVLSITNFEIHRGIIYAICGQPGSGKSTFLEILSATQKPDAGTFVFDGLSAGSSEFRSKYEEEVFFLPQVPVKARGKVGKYMQKRIKLASWSNDKVEDRLRNISKLFSLGDKLDRKIGSLSPGERRWVDLAIAMASDSKVLIIDELEQHTSYDQLELVKRQLQRKCNYEGTTVIMSTLNPITIRRLSGVSVTLDRGRIAMIRSVRDGNRSRRTQGNDSDRSRPQGGNKKGNGGGARRGPGPKTGGRPRRKPQPPQQ